MSDSVRPAETTPKERLLELVAILARGIFGCKQAAARVSPKPSKRPVVLDQGNTSRLAPVCIQ